MQILGNGVYSLREAASLAGLTLSRVREWFRGRGSSRSGSFLQSQYSTVGGDFAVSFHDLIEAALAGRLRDEGVSLQTIRKVHERLKQVLGVAHPFCRQELFTDGSRIFTLEAGIPGAPVPKEALTDQLWFPDVVLPILTRIDYDEKTKLALRWRITDWVVIDPAVNLGKPIVEEVGIGTVILASSYEANDRDEELVAHWYCVEPKHVLAAVEFERSRAA